MSEELHALITYRLEQAHESLDSAQLLLVHEKYRPSVNRSYYAMFYAILALLALKNFKPSKHSGAISFFNREFVKTGLIDKEFSRWLHEAFDLRQRSDYR
ncbi:MAG: HEPN domain-containing protein, partial [bacterium]|nr:HEPN domain-containing protein [bacterium]